MGESGVVVQVRQSGESLPAERMTTSECMGIRRQKDGTRLLHAALDVYSDNRSTVMSPGWRT